MRKIKGRKIGNDGLMEDRKGDVVYPHFFIDIQHLPEAKDWEIGKTYDVTLRVRQTGLHVSRHEGRKEDTGEATFAIVGVQPHGPVEPEKRYKRKVKK